MWKRELLYSGFTWDHHDDNSGYQKIVVSQKDYVDGGKLWGGRRPIGSRLRRVNFFLIDVFTILRAWRYRAVFIFYPEQTAYMSPLLLWLLGKKVIFALHLGPDYWVERNDSLFLKLKRAQLRFVSGFIVLSNQQREVYERIFLQRVVMIPHGAYVTPLQFQMPAIPRYISVIGDRYRDYNQLAKIIVAFKGRHPEVRFQLIGMRYENLNGVENMETVFCHPRLGRDEYWSILSHSTMILLPLVFATANNALLEGLLAGVPVYCSNVHGVTEYLLSQEYMFDTVEDAISKYEQAASIPQAELERNAYRFHQYVRERYSWDIIQKQVVEFCLS
jgi:glycosyltransferase involved in cell wall biosynthesis